MVIAYQWIRKDVAGKVCGLAQNTTKGGWCHWRDPNPVSPDWPECQALYRHLIVQSVSEVWHHIFGRGVQRNGKSCNVFEQCWTLRLLEQQFDQPSSFQVHASRSITTLTVAKWNNRLHWRGHHLCCWPWGIFLHSSGSKLGQGRPGSASWQVWGTGRR